MMKVRVLNFHDELDIAEVGKIVALLNYPHIAGIDPLTIAKLIGADPQTTVLAGFADDGTLLTVASLHLSRSFCDGLQAELKDLAVANEADAVAAVLALLEEVFRICQEAGADRLIAWSNPRQIRLNHAFVSATFEVRNTNLYRLDLRPQPLPEPTAA